MVWQAQPHTEARGPGEESGPRRAQSFPSWEEHTLPVRQTAGVGAHKVDSITHFTDDTAGT